MAMVFMRGWPSMVVASITRNIMRLVAMGSVPHVQSLHGANVYHQHPFLHQGLRGCNVHCLHPHATARGFVEMMPTISNNTPTRVPSSIWEFSFRATFSGPSDWRKRRFISSLATMASMVWSRTWCWSPPHQVTLHGVTWTIPEGIATPPSTGRGWGTQQMWTLWANRTPRSSMGIWHRFPRFREEMLHALGLLGAFQ